MESRFLRRAIARAKDGDADAHRWLYERYAPVVFRYVRGLVHDEYEAEDVTQMVFLKLMWTLPSFDERQGSFTGWLLRVARNLTIDTIRRRRAIPSGDLLIADRPWDDAGRRCALALQDALAALSEDQRQVLVLRQVVGLRPREIATRLARTEGSVHALHHRARTAVRATLTRMEAGPATRRPRAAERPA